MRIVLQRVSSAAVTTDNRILGKIGKGLLVLLGVASDDTYEIADKMIDKIKSLRIFADQNGKTNLSSVDICGEILVVSQFTLYADCRKGNRPGFTNAAEPGYANNMYNYFIDKCRGNFKDVQHGEFGADMSVSLVNDGPFTLVLDSVMWKEARR